MVRKIICLDTSVLIDYFRKQNKQNSFFFKIITCYDFDFAISVITKLEILNGSNEEQKDFWERLFQKMQIIPLGEDEVEVASRIIKKLKSQNKLIDLPDILIAATAKTHNLRLATLNKNHFERIEKLSLIIN
jgi:tRNA(fMet)-specific endonuclease VapC